MRVHSSVLTVIALACVELSATDISWRTDPVSAMAESRKTGKPVMIDFYTDWCGWCKELDKVTYRDPEVIGLSGSFVSLKLDAEKDPKGPELAEKYGVDGFPTILFLEPDGSLVGRIVGYLPAQDFALRMRKVTEYRTRVKTYMTEYRGGEYANSPDLLSMLAELDRVREIPPIYDRLRSRSALTAAQQEKYALLIAENFLNGGEYNLALTYVTLIEGIDPGSEAAHSARLMRSIALFGSGDKTGAMKYLDGLITNAKTPEDWKARYREMIDRMKKAD